MSSVSTKEVKLKKAKKSGKAKLYNRGAWIYALPAFIKQSGLPLLIR
jgi:hypothetical protein